MSNESSTINTLRTLWMGCKLLSESERDCGSVQGRQTQLQALTALLTKEHNMLVGLLHLSSRLAATVHWLLPPWTY